MSTWGWQIESEKAGRQGLMKALQALSAAAPWITVMILFAMLWFVGRTYAIANGTVFELPDRSSAEAVKADLVALVVPMPRDTLVFFDDARYRLSDDASLSAFGDHLKSSRRSKGSQATLLVVADRRVSGGDLMKLAAQAGRCGIDKVFFAAKNSGGQE